MANQSVYSPANSSPNASPKPSADRSAGSLLKQVLSVDSAVSLVCGALHVGASNSLQGLTGISSGLYQATGLFLLVFGVLVGLLAWLERPPSPLVWLLIAGNLAWALASAALVFQPMGNYTAMGLSYLVVNALWVVLMASLEFVGLQRRDRAMA